MIEPCVYALKNQNGDNMAFNMGVVEIVDVAADRKFRKWNIDVFQLCSSQEL